MNTATVLVSLVGLLLGGCYVYDYAYYEPVSPVSAPKTVTYVEQPDITYVRYVEPSYVYVKYYDPWWYTPVISWSIWCDFCFCRHKHYYDCPKRYSDRGVRAVTYPDPPERYSRDAPVRSRSEILPSPPVRRESVTPSAPTRSEPVRSAPVRSSPPVRGGRTQR